MISLNVKGTAVDAPGDAPQQGGQRAVGMGDDFGTELEYAAFFRVFFDDLHTLTGGNQFPIVRVGFGIVVEQRG